jgi:ubiquinol-cytochrome c reductase iron-sulfur subunit
MDETNTPRRDFLYLATGAVAAIGAAAFSWPLFKQMSPAPDTLAKMGVDVDLSLLKEGEQMHVIYMGRPVAIRHRTPAEIAAAQADDEADLPHFETDQSRLKPKPDGEVDPCFLVFYPICTHFGGIVVGEAGDFDGWYCPCHGAHFDTSGRVRKGPAPVNMEIPTYKWISDTAINLRPQ